MPFCCQDVELSFFGTNATFEEKIQQPKAKHANALNLSVSATV